MDNKYTWQQIVEGNAVIGEALGFDAVPTYIMLNNDGDIVYYGKYWPYGKDNRVKEVKGYPSFHSDWNCVHEAVIRLQKMEISIDFSILLHITTIWERLIEKCKKKQSNG